VEFIESFRCCCDRRGTFENVWLHGKNALDLFVASASLARALKVASNFLLQNETPLITHNPQSNSITCLKNPSKKK
jgi:hypothetical protein